MRPATADDLPAVAALFDQYRCFYRQPSDPETAQQFIDSVKALFRETKLGAPSLSVIGYSQASSAVGEWRTGMTDVEGIVAEGEPKFHPKLSSTGP